MDPQRHADLAQGLFSDGGLELGDFLKAAPVQKFDRVVMNPPFSRQADIDHVTHAARFLKPGGRMVAIMSAGTIFRQNSKAVAFRGWLEALGGTLEDLPDGAFKASGTMVRTCIVSFDIPAEPEEMVQAMTA